MPEIKESETKKLFKSVLFGTAAAICAALIFLLIEALVMTVAGIPSKFASPLATVSLALGGISGGWISAHKNGKRGLLCGILTAAAVFLIITLIGMVITENFTLMSLIHFAVLALSGGIGGIIGVNKSEKRKVI